MTNEAINRAVAEELGFRVEKVDDRWFLYDPDEFIIKRNSFDEHDAWRWVPDFCNNYNVIAEMRNRLKPEEQILYCRFLLVTIIGPGTFGLTPDYWRILNATPKQQSEAFLRMRGKWRDNE